MAEMCIIVRVLSEHPRAVQTVQYKGGKTGKEFIFLGVIISHTECPQ